MNKIYYLIYVLSVLFVDLTACLHVKSKQQSLDLNLDCLNSFEVDLKFNNFFSKPGDKFYMTYKTNEKNPNEIIIDMHNFYKNEIIDVRIKNNLLNTTNLDIKNQLITLEIEGENYLKAYINFKFDNCPKILKYFFIDENNFDFLNQNINIISRNYPVHFILPKFDLFANQKIKFSAIENNIVSFSYGWIFPFIIFGLIILTN